MRPSFAGKFEYTGPKENLAKGEGPQHTIDFSVGGKVIGRAEINYYSKPIPIYQITDIYVDHDQSGKGYASEIMAQVEGFLLERKKPGFIVDAINLDSPASGMYARRGWKELPGGLGQYVFNMPKSVDLSIFKGFPCRYDVMWRDSWQDKVE